MNYLDLPTGSRAPEMVNAVVEVPCGHTNKYEYDPRLQVFPLDRPLYASVHFPGDYGFIPGTRSNDGDPLDVLILVEHPTFSGCLMEVRYCLSEAPSAGDIGSLAHAAISKWQSLLPKTLTDLSFLRFLLFNLKLFRFVTGLRGMPARGHSPWRGAEMSRTLGEATRLA